MTDKIAGEPRQAVRIVIRPANLDGQVLAFDVARLFQPLAETREIPGGGCSNLQQSDHRHVQPLRARSER
jgi:hypothetical protein